MPYPTYQLILLDSNGNVISSSNPLLVGEATTIAGEDLTNQKLVTEQRYTYGRVTATGTTTVKV